MFSSLLNQVSRTRWLHFDWIYRHSLKSTSINQTTANTGQSQNSQLMNSVCLYFHLLCRASVFYLLVWLHLVYAILLQREKTEIWWYLQQIKHPTIDCINGKLHRQKMLTQNCHIIENIISITPPMEFGRCLSFLCQYSSLIKQNHDRYLPVPPEIILFISCGCRKYI